MKPSILENGTFFYIKNKVNNLNEMRVALDKCLPNALMYYEVVLKQLPVLNLYSLTLKYVLRHVLSLARPTLILTCVLYSRS